jgi:pyridinium-3,5-biscarboxylic acid mononucleotide synthase
VTESPIADVGGFARLDVDRLARTGDPEVVLADGKTPEQTAAVLRRLSSSHPERAVLATRCDEATRALCRDALDGAAVDDVGRTVTVGTLPEPAGLVVVVAAGTSDLPVAAEAMTTVGVFGARAELVADVGVAGLHRLLAERDHIAAADAVIVVAGMDGALPGVVAGLVGVPLIAVPTSVGYGASFGGIAALLTMLNACAPGVSVVNIDNGFGAAVSAARIARRAAKPL